jgi:hypothetical protein
VNGAGLTDLGEDDEQALAVEIDRRVRALPDQTVGPIRGVRREYSRRVRSAPAERVVGLALALVGRQRWVAYELLYHHPGALEVQERLGRGPHSPC